MLKQSILIYRFLSINDILLYLICLCRKELKLISSVLFTCGKLDSTQSVWNITFFRCVEIS